MHFQGDRQKYQEQEKTNSMLFDYHLSLLVYLSNLHTLDLYIGLKAIATRMRICLLVQIRLFPPLYASFPTEVSSYNTKKRNIQKTQ